MNFGEKLRNARKKAGLTQQQVADALELERSSIARYELGQVEPKLKIIPKFCEILNVSAEYLLY